MLHPMQWSYLRVFCPFSHLVNLKTSLHSRVSRKLNRENRPALSLNHFIFFWQILEMRKHFSHEIKLVLFYAKLNDISFHVVASHVPVICVSTPPTSGFSLVVSIYCKINSPDISTGNPVVHWLIINIPIYWNGHFRVDPHFRTQPQETQFWIDLIFHNRLKPKSKP